MKASIKRILAVGALAAVASTSAFAFDSAIIAPGNGSLILTAFDQDAGKSVVVDLGLNYLDFLNSSTARDGRAGIDVTSDAGNSYSFNIDMSIFGGNTSAVKYTVFAADASNNAATTEALVTAQFGLGDNAFPTLNNGHVANTISGAGGYGEIVNNCGALTVCTGTVSPATGFYFGGSNWGTNFQYLPFNAAGDVGTTLGFYGLNRTAANSSQFASSYEYVNSAGVFASWLLSADGTLTYSSAAVSAIPLPAAVWLLLSGLGGLGVIGRRRDKLAA